MKTIQKQAVNAGGLYALGTVLVAQGTAMIAADMGKSVGTFVGAALILVGGVCYIFGKSQ